MAVQEISRDRQFRTDREAGLPYVDFLESPWAGWGPSAKDRRECEILEFGSS